MDKKLNMPFDVRALDNNPIPRLPLTRQPGYDRYHVDRSLDGRTVDIRVFITKTYPFLELGHPIQYQQLPFFYF